MHLAVTNAGKTSSNHLELKMTAVARPELLYRPWKRRDGRPWSRRCGKRTEKKRSVDIGMILPTFRSGTDLIRSETGLISLLIMLLFLLLWPLQNSSRLRRFKLNRGEIWQNCSSSKYAYRLLDISLPLFRKRLKMFLF